MAKVNSLFATRISEKPSGTLPKSGGNPGVKFLQEDSSINIEVNNNKRPSREAKNRKLRQFSQTYKLDKCSEDNSQ